MVGEVVENVGIVGTQLPPMAFTNPGGVIFSYISFSGFYPEQLVFNPSGVARPHCKISLVYPGLLIFNLCRIDTCGRLYWPVKKFTFIQPRIAKLQARKVKYS